MKQPFPGWQPKKEQMMLIRSAVLDPETSFSFWKKWRNGIDIENLDRDSYRLLPMVFRNLDGHIGNDDRYYGRLKGAYKKSWFSNRMIVRAALPLFDGLEQTGISPVLLKGIHLISRYYDDIAVRPIGDADFLVRWEDAERTGQFLESAGYKMIEKYRYPVFSESFMSGRRSVGYVSRDGYRCDLHWNISIHRCHPEADIGFLKDTENVSIGGLKLRGLRSEYLLLNILEHGSCGYPEPSVRWIPDSLKILETNPSPDWDIFNSGAVSSHLETTVGPMLQFLIDEFGAGVPAGAVIDLQKVKTSKISLEIADSMNQPGTRLGRDLKEFLRHFLRYRIYMKEYKNEHISKSLSGFIRFLGFRWGKKPGIFFPLLLLKKTAGKLARYIKRRSG